MKNPMKSLEDFIIKYDLEITVVICFLALCFFAFALCYEEHSNKSHNFIITSSSGKSYYIDDYIIVDETIVFSIDGVEYHLIDYSITSIEK